MDLRTVGQALRYGRSALQTVSENPGMDVQLLLSDILSKPREWLLAHPEYPLKSQQGQTYHDQLSHLAAGVPLPYVLGWWFFFGRRFAVSPAVLIPRPDTECLVELALGILSVLTHPALVLDAGTGSGCIGITIAAERKRDRIIACDISDEALRVAVGNARLHEVDSSIDFVLMDGFTALSCKMDLVCANFPYIESTTLPGLAVSRHEPLHALDGGEDGFATIRPALRRLPDVLRAGGTALFEIAANQGPLALQEARQDLPTWDAVLHADLAGRDRILAIQRPACN
ncbi:MAG: peptide chain release factor N(5)-glutamine methyltransferase [Anaerolineales bacterium]|nr:peptide chain release factor N(5)-glutamine methyltransferase [Anaerolineales bacterium]